MNRYKELRRTRPELFTNHPGGIEILSDAADVRAVRRAVRAWIARRMARGSRARRWWARYAAMLVPVRLGVLSADPFLLLLRDPVRFPDGTLGVYDRVVSPRPTTTVGVVVLPLLGSDSGADGRIVLIEHYRHATRSWHWEAVRGSGEPGATGEEDAVRELQEELGVRPEELIPLGATHPDTGLLGDRVELFAARIASIGPLDGHEGIRRAVTVSLREAEDMVVRGEITDGFTLGALYRARLAGLFDET
ncbi:NUDIX hydrolase [Streptomyces poonensis]|uniref:Nudix hydrolase domain-containing protein n=1 Tax=Streptomyces poonensis TaxID=68255 RepID=A0A918UTE9_9ACTN|nr:NUDIX hydrolase [Streptomyces poonensis]GGZ32855.1 hypothetical protein GCM10010365_62260 [Streptomyces poonensis]GLJ93169.1 hypothetical protein GCM10017589_57810 [Streptomyces poonensis]